jgi:hypothetical protein
MAARFTTITKPKRMLWRLRVAICVKVDNIDKKHIRKDDLWHQYHCRDREI